MYIHLCTCVCLEDAFMILVTSAFVFILIIVLHGVIIMFIIV